jgi:hypothetical protein
MTETYLKIFTTKKMKKLDTIKTKRLKAIFIWLDDTSFTSKLVKKTGQHFPFYMYDFWDKTDKLIPKKYVKGSTPSLTLILLLILQKKSYCDDTIRLLEVLDFEYRQFNEIYLKKEHSITDDFWMNSEIEGKEIWDERNLEYKIKI